MNEHGCCNPATTGTRRAVTRAAAPVGGLACGLLWLACPKCPACVAGYAALAGGITLSVPAAALLLSGARLSLLAVSGFVAAVLIVRAVRSLVR